MLVGRLPQSGWPEESSKMEPTAAIAATQEPNRNNPLFGVHTVFSLYPDLDAIVTQPGRGYNLSSGDGARVEIFFARP